MTTAPAPVPPLGLTPANLTLPKEGTYFVFVLILSILIWLLLAVSIVGAFYALFQRRDLRRAAPVGARVFRFVA